MKRATDGALLSTVFVDYDNIYLSLKRKSEEAAKRFAKDAGQWITEIASGRLITPTNGPPLDMPRRIVMNRCYGNPVPRRNSHDNSTDMNSFPFVRHHYLRAGFEVIDCPPLTAQLKNSADIRMVMDVRDYLLHDTYFDEFIILSGDADFTPVLHRLRQHARRTVIYSNDYTAAPYTAISDGEVREADLIAVLLEGRLPKAVAEAPSGRKGLPSPAALAEARQAIVNDVLGHVQAEKQPLLLEVLADRAVRTLGHERTVGTGWGGAGSFRELLVADLPDGIEVTGEAPHYVIDSARQRIPAEPKAVERDPRPSRASVEQFASGFGEVRPEPLIPAATQQSAGYSEPKARARPLSSEPAPAPAARAAAPEPAPAFAPAPAPASSRSEPARQDLMHRDPLHREPLHREPAADFAEPRHAAAGLPLRQAATTAAAGERAHAPHPAPQPSAAIPRQPVAAPAVAQPAPAAAQSDQATAIQRSIARIHEACQAPPISPPEYRVLFDVMAEEINTNGLTGTQTLVNICERAKAVGVDIRKDDARFILEVVSEADPWFEEGASAPLFAGRFRNFVIARCKGQGLQLTATELDLIEAWFTGSTPRVAARKETQAPAAPAAPAAHQPDPDAYLPARGYGQPAPQPTSAAADWFAAEQAQPQPAAGYPEDPPDFGRYGDDSDDFPRVLRNRRA